MRFSRVTGDAAGPGNNTGRSAGAVRRRRPRLQQPSQTLLWLLCTLHKAQNLTPRPPQTFILFARSTWNFSCVIKLVIYSVIYVEYLANDQTTNADCFVATNTKCWQEEEERFSCCLHFYKARLRMLVLLVNKDIFLVFKYIYILMFGES